MRRQLPPLRAIEHFEAVAEHGNLNRASEQLGVTKGAVSQQIRKLEEFLGVALFQRSGRSLILTDAGQRYYAAVRSSLETLEDATLRLRRQRQRRSFRLSVLPAFASMWLAHRIHHFQSEYDDLDIEVGSDASLVDFSRSDAHVGLRFGRGPGSDVVSVELTIDDLYPVCSAQYRDDLDINKPEDLQRCRLLHDTVWQDDWPRWYAAVGAHLSDAQEGQYFSLYSVAIDVARAGGGVAIGHDLLVRDLVSRGDLVRPFSTTIKAREAYYLVWPGRSGDLSFVRGFAQWLKRTLPTD